MLFKKFVELGRVIQITKGKDAGKLAVIVDIIDCNRLLVDGPGLHRQECKLKDARLLKFKLKVSHGMAVSSLKKRWERALIDFRFKRMTYAKRQQQIKKREENSDFDYFKMRYAQRKRSNILHNAMKTVLNKEPGTLLRFKREFKNDLALKLGYVKRKKLTAEQRKERDAKLKAKYEASLVEKRALRKKLREKRAAARVARKAKVAKKAAAGSLKVREKVVKKPKAKKAKPGVQKRANRQTMRRQRIDAGNKKKLASRRQKAKASA